MKDKRNRVWPAFTDLVWRVYALVAVVGFPIALYFVYNNDPIPFPNPFDSDGGHGNYAARDGQVFVDVDEAIIASTGLAHRFVINEENMNIGVYNASNFVLTLADRTNQEKELTGTGPSFPVSDPLAAAQKFASVMRSKKRVNGEERYTAEVVAKVLKNHPDKLYVVVIKDPRYSDSFSLGQPLLGWQPAFRVRTTSMGFPKFRSFEEFAKVAPELFPVPLR